MQHTLVPSLVDSLSSLMLEAAGVIMPYFNSALSITQKSDNSPLTQADIASHRILKAGLTRLTPDIPSISEEDAHFPEAPERYWLVDPLDGTLAFTRGEEHFSINLGLVERGRAMFGMICHPVSGAVYYGGQGMGAHKLLAGQRQHIQARSIPSEGTVVVKSAAPMSKRMHTYLESVPQLAEVRGISSAIKFCLIAEGQADLYPRFGRTMEWDTAAGQAIVEAAGGSMQTSDKEEFVYGKPHFENGGFIVRGVT